MQEKVKQTAEYVRTGHLHPHEAWTALTCMILKSMEYPLPALTLTEEECRKLMWEVIKVYLPKANVNRFIQRDILYGNIGVQGLGLKNLFLTQGISHIVNIIEHQWKSTITGHLITSGLEQLRLEIGLNIPILSSNYEHYQQWLLTQSCLDP